MPTDDRSVINHAHWIDATIRPTAVEVMEALHARC
jgi:hypothetical protein